ncbi:DUF6223 family protein [Chryseolinea sp. H1M3-3]|uniref:DUF6223 family protein n=1 Tax=Chryseolinea sp. H1M3-3 TaxID=3034144 RepID=UPI0023ECDD3A|nr:DUF6223 family protein [Chryseolinea sp. H1M3-3]
MRSFIPFIFPAILTIAVSLLATYTVFSQTEQKSNVAATGSEKHSYVTGITTARAKSLIGVAVGLSSLIIGWRAKKRSAVGTRTQRHWAITALALGLVALFLGVTHLANVTGGFGSGGGKAGAIVALFLGLIGASISWIALRSQQK